jgi:hypothetical protein
VVDRLGRPVRERDDHGIPCVLASSTLERITFHVSSQPSRRAIVRTSRPRSARETGFALTALTSWPRAGGRMAGWNFGPTCEGRGVMPAAAIHPTEQQLAAEFVLCVSATPGALSGALLA